MCANYVDYRFRGLNECCMSWNCLRNLKDLPQRCEDIAITPLHQLPYFDYPVCAACKLPEKTEDFLDAACDFLECNVILDYEDHGFKLFYPGNTQVLQAHYFVKERHCQQFNYKQYRRNLLNLFFVSADYNAVVHHHQTFRYKPRGCDLEMLTIRLLREAHPRLEREIVGMGNQYFCACWPALDL